MRAEVDWSVENAPRSIPRPEKNAEGASQSCYLRGRGHGYGLHMPRRYSDGMATNSVEKWLQTIANHVERRLCHLGRPRSGFSRPGMRYRAPLSFATFLFCRQAEFSSLGFCTATDNASAGCRATSTPPGPSNIPGSMAQSLSSPKTPVGRNATRAIGKLAVFDSPSFQFTRWARLQFAGRPINFRGGRHAYTCITSAPGVGSVPHF